MSITNIEKINTLIGLLDIKIKNELSKSEVDIDYVKGLSDIRLEYVDELNKLIRVNNRNDLFKKKNYK
jgi:hypothetical protein|tara:strand:+ start:476 stop:679 length:204 start_codon:yes stop_codon:yes gene_type:complete